METRHLSYRYPPKLNQIVNQYLVVQVPIITIVAILPDNQQQTSKIMIRRNKGRGEIQKQAPTLFQLRACFIHFLLELVYLQSFFLSGFYNTQRYVLFTRSKHFVFNVFVNYFLFLGTEVNACMCELVGRVVKNNLMKF